MGNGQHDLRHSLPATRTMVHVGISNCRLGTTSHLKRSPIRNTTPLAPIASTKETHEPRTQLPVLRISRFVFGSYWHNKGPTIRSTGAAVQPWFAIEGFWRRPSYLGRCLDSKYLKWIVLESHQLGRCLNGRSPTTDLPPLLCRVSLSTPTIRLPVSPGCHRFPTFFRAHGSPQSQRRVPPVNSSSHKHTPPRGCFSPARSRSLYVSN